MFKDLDLETLKALIKFIYTDSLDAEKDDIKALFSTADKYDIQFMHVSLVAGSIVTCLSLGMSFVCLTLKPEGG